MESKHQILDSFDPPQPSRIRIATYELIPDCSVSPEALSQVENFAHTHSWPLVLKPDIGERGRAVTIVRDRTEAEEWLKSQKGQSAIIQEYIRGVEFGIHWSRHPEQAQGQVLSIARKQPQALIGDGSSTIEQLILHHPRHVAMAKHFLAQFNDRLLEVPEEGKQISLTQLGTHALGALFEDARSLLTPELQSTLDELATRFPGFHFGRYDLRVPSEEQLQQGKGLVILELNGVTGEPAHIYQPDYPLRSGLKDLVSHYEIASHIGEANISAGAQKITLSEILKVVQAHRKHCAS